MTEDPDVKLNWIIQFSRGSRLYTYLYRTQAYMTSVVKKYYDEHAGYPFRMWVIVDDEMQKVEIT